LKVESETNDVARGIATPTVVITRLAPVIRQIFKNALSRKMDGRVKPGHDEL
jgi:hypothetical protein